ncbi:MAG: type II secretion system F family protein, partial [Planctomycetota bacterium]
SLFVFALLYLLQWILVGKKQSVSHRLAEFSGEETITPSEIPLIVRDDDLSENPLLNRLLKKLQFAERLRNLIEQAGMDITVGHLVLRMLLFGMAGALLALRSGNYVSMLGFFSLTGSLPLLQVFFRKKRRLKMFESGFPDAIDIMRNAIRSGFGVVKALQLVAEEGPDPIGVEFRKTFEEINLGLSLRDALLNLSNRIDSIDLKLFVTAVLIQRESGGNLNEILFKISTTTRERFKLAGQIRVFTAQARFSGLILGLLPMTFGLIVSLFSPDYIMTLFREPAGHWLLGISIVLQLVGFWAIRFIMKIRLQ